MQIKDSYMKLYEKYITERNPESTGRTKKPMKRFPDNPVITKMKFQRDTIDRLLGDIIDYYEVGNQSALKTNLKMVEKVLREFVDGLKKGSKINIKV